MYINMHQTGKCDPFQVLLKSSTVDSPVNTFSQDLDVSTHQQFCHQLLRLLNFWWTTAIQGL